MYLASQQGNVLSVIERYRIVTCKAVNDEVFENDVVAGSDVNRIPMSATTI